MPLLCNCGVISLLRRLWCDATVIKFCAMIGTVIGLVNKMIYAQASDCAVKGVREAHCFG